MFVRTAIVALALLATALAGCIGSPADELDEARLPPVDEVLYELGLIENVALALPDGLVARGTVYLPDVPDGVQVPTLVDLGPYYGNPGRTTQDYSERHPPNLLYHHFLERGYAIALVALRGTGLSEGCFKIGGHEEWADAAAIVEGLADQPWSDGTVAMAGISYDGTTPWEAAVMAPPALKAIVPGEGITDMYNYSFFEGAPIWGAPLFNTRYPISSTDVVYVGNDMATHVANQPTNVCTEYVDGAAADYEAYLDGVHGPFWDERHVVPSFSDIEAATLVVHGFQDWNVKMDHVQHIWSELPEPKAMLLGQWQHNVPWRNTFEPDWSIPWYNDTVETWLDAYVLGDPVALERAEAFGPVAFQDSTGQWYNISAWPPEDVAPAVKQLHPDGTLSSEPAAPGEMRFRSELWDQQREAGVETVADQAFVVRFTSGSPDEPHWFVGNPFVALTLSVDLPTGGYLTATLTDVSDEGRFMVTKGHLSLAQREGRDRAVDVPTNTPIDVRVPMYAVAHVLEPGHRLELTIESEEHQGWSETSYRQQAFTVHLGEDTTSALHLPGWTPRAE